MHSPVNFIVFNELHRDRIAEAETARLARQRQARRREAPERLAVPGLATRAAARPRRPGLTHSLLPLAHEGRDALAPGRPRGLPAELALRALRSTRRGSRTSSPRRARRSRRPTQRGTWRGGGAPIAVGERRQPLADRRRLVVGDVVDPARPCRARARRASPLAASSMCDERPHAAAVADDRELARLDRLPLVAAGREPGARAVEAAVAQRDAAGAGDRRLERAGSPRASVRTCFGGVGSSGSSSVLTGPPTRAYGQAREALRDDALDAGLARPPRAGGRCPRCAGGWWRRTSARSCRDVEVAAERGHLVDDRVGPGGGDGGADAVAVEAVDHHRLGAERAQRVGLRRAAGGAGDGVAVAGEEGDRAPVRRRRWPRRGRSSCPSDETAVQACDR